MKQSPLVHQLLVVGLLALGWAPLHVAAAPKAVTNHAVDSNQDAPDLNPGNGVCDADITAGDPPAQTIGCTLRAALQEATVTAGPDVITFTQALSGTVISLRNELGALLITTNEVQVLGDPAAELNEITVDGSALEANQAIFHLIGSNNVIDSLTLQGGRAAGIKVGGSLAGLSQDNWLSNLVIVGAAGPAIEIMGDGAESERSARTLISDSYIGVRPENLLGSCVAADGNSEGVFIFNGAKETSIVDNWLIGCNRNEGIFLTGEGSNNTRIEVNRIGGDQTGLGNGAHNIRIEQSSGIPLTGTVISNNTILSATRSGIYLSGAAVATTTITGNRIGLIEGALIDTAIGNGDDGIFVNGFQTGTLTIAENVISGNIQRGIAVEFSSGAIQISRNFIGLDHTGSYGVANGDSGILLNSSGAVAIGGVSDSRNIISGNGDYGIRLLDTPALVEGNIIGANATGDIAVPNAGGIYISGNGAQIGSLLGAENNQLISGNTTAGINLGNGANNHIYPSTSVGLGQLAGEPLPLGNGGPGIIVGLTAVNNQIEPGIVAYNNGSGILADALAPTVTSGNAIVPRSVFSNTLLPIDLYRADGASGHTANDSGDGDSGANGLLNYPVLTGAAGNQLTGTGPANSLVYLYRAVGNPAGDGGGGHLAGFVATNGAGSWSYTPPAGPDPLTWSQAAVLACEGSCIAGSNSSEMSPLVPSTLPTANADGYFTERSKAITVTVGAGLLANDLNPKGQAFQVTSPSAVTTGNLTLQTNGSFVYQPPAGFQGAATFTYRALDAFGEQSAPATVTINVGRAFNFMPLIDKGD